MADWPLVGRASQLQLVGRELGEGNGGGAGGIVIAGPAGVGKTRLAREALAAAAATGAGTAWVAATPATHAIPFGAFASLLPPLTTTYGSARLLRDAAGHLTAPSDGRVVVGVDDAQLLDPLSATLLLHLARTGELALVVTLRSGTMAPDAVVALWKDDLFPRLELQALSPEDTAALVEAALGGPVDRSTHDGLWRLSQGNPMLLQELVHEGEQRRKLTWMHGVWTWQGSMTGGAGLQTLVSGRVVATDEPVRAVLELLALAEPLPVEVLAELASSGAVDAAERAGLVSVALEGRDRQTRLVHPLYGDAVRAGLSPETVRVRSAALARALRRDTSPEPADLVRLTLLELDAGGAVDAAQIEAAARHAGDALDHPLAERLAAAAIAAGGGAGAELLLANALLWQGKLAEADARLSELATATDLLDEDRALVALRRSGLLFWGLDRPLDAEDVLRRAEAVITEDPARQVLAAQRSCLLTSRGQVTAAVATANAVLQCAAAEPVAVGLAAVGGSLALAMTGRHRDAVVMAQRGWAALVGATGEVIQLSAPLADSETTALRFSGRVAEAARRLDEIDAWAIAEADGTLGAVVILLRAKVELCQGDLSPAARRFRDALTSLAGFDPGSWRYHCHLGLAEATAALGDAAEAKDHLAMAGDLRPTSSLLFRARELLVRTWVEAVSGDVPAAVATALAAAGEARQAGLWAVEAGALHTALRLAPAPLEGVADRLATLAAMADNALMAAAADHAAARDADSGPELEAVAARFEQMDMRLLAVDAHAHAALAHTRAGAGEAAVHAAARTRGLLRHCGAAPTPPVAELPDLPALTPRERHIARLAGSGLSNKAIAGELQVSVRTVEGHLALIYSKLAVHRRTELALLLPALAES